MHDLVVTILHEIAHIIQKKSLGAFYKMWRIIFPYCFEDSLQYERVADRLARKIYICEFLTTLPIELNPARAKFTAYMSISSMINLFIFHQSEFIKINNQTKKIINELRFIELSNEPFEIYLDF
jgi:hypothetical protein